MKFAQFAIACTAGLLTVAAAGSLEAAVTTTIYSTSTGSVNGWGSTPTNQGTAPLGSDKNEITLAIGHPDAWIIYDFGQKTTFGDVSITQRNYYSTGTVSNTPNNFVIQVQENDDPTATTGWTTIATASNIFGYNYPSLANYDAGRRIEFTPVTNKQYFRYLNTNQNATGVTLQKYVAFEELQVGRQVIVTDSQYGTTSASNPLNYATDSNAATTMRATGTSGSLNLDALVPQGLLVNGITLEHSNTVDGFFPSGQVQVKYASDNSNPTNFDKLAVDTSLTSTTAAGATYTLNFSQAVNARYFQLIWGNTLNTGATYTEFAEIGINTVPATVPEPAALSLLGAAGLLLVRRKRR
jgi:hypothetical protein